jgi:thiaminase/transcriptional activator TenA
MTFTERAWEASAEIRKAIDNHPFVVGLGEGTLDGERFGYYMRQDARYLADYGRSLALCGSQAADADEVLFWTASAVRAVAVERELHAAVVEDLTSVPKAPTCTAYTSYLAALGGAGSYPVLTAGLLPCFWIYLDVGSRLLDQARDVDTHPYGRWITTYADPAFEESTRQAREIVDRAAESASTAEQARMLEAFLTCSRYEWMFWDAAWRMETWPVQDG